MGEEDKLSEENRKIDFQSLVFANDLPWGLKNYEQLFPPEAPATMPHQLNEEELEIEQVVPETEQDVMKMLNDAKRAGAIR